MNTIPEYGVMSVDPGGSTGVTWAIVRDEGTVADRLVARRSSNGVTLTGPWRGQGAELARIWGSFTASCLRQDVPAYLVVEDFLLTKFKSSDRTGLYPVWIAGCLAGALGPTHEIFWQTPGFGASINDERLRLYKMWVPGKIHERSANRHLAAFVGDASSQRARQARARTLAHAHAHGAQNH